MEAMETVLPAGVQVTSIEPIRAPDGHITVHVRVVGPRDRADDLVANLEHSRRFLLPRITGETPNPATTPRSARSPSASPTASTSNCSPTTIRPRLRKSVSPPGPCTNPLRPFPPATSQAARQRPPILHRPIRLRLQLALSQSHPWRPAMSADGSPRLGASAWHLRSPGTLPASPFCSSSPSSSQFASASIGPP
jgi:hypothetical protein